jgi:gliding motility-associated-like protein
VAGNIDINMNEDESFSLIRSVFDNVYVDSDNDPLAEVRIETVPANGELQLNGVPVFAGDVIAAADLANLDYIPAADYNGPDSFAFSLGDGTEFSSIVSLDFNVRPVNDAPVITAIPDISIGVGEIIPNVTFTVTDIDNDLSEVSVSTSSDNATLISSLDLTNTGGDYLLAISVNNAAGTATITVTAADPTDATTETFIFELQPRITDVPNLLIVNGTARNRTWGISHFGISDQVLINVYDDSGTVLFTTTDASQEWDGTFNGKEVSSGVYYYTIEIEGRDKVLQGALKVIR